MKTRSIYYFLSLAVLLGLTACKKDKENTPTPLERLPAATTEGKNTWGCLGNGEAWTASGENNMRADWTVPTVCPCNMSFSRQSVTLALQNGFTPNIYQLGPQPKDNLAKLITRNRLYEYNFLHKGGLKISRLDRQAGGMAGTFEFIMVCGPEDTLRVTNGRFDIGNMDR